ncbi:MAG: hypothetical protein FJZ59_07590 [Chlamydiae bacterium]|nr:hypothetical protein [Chlamydiota bacterium]
MKILEKIASQAGLARFASFTYVSRSTGEVAKYIVQLGFNYRNVLQKSIDQLEIDRQIMCGLSRQAADEIMESLKASLNKTQTKYTKKDIYETYKDASGKTVHGIKINQNDSSIKIFGLITNKFPISPAIFPAKEVENSPLVKEKNKIKKDLPIGRFREFALDGLATARLDGETLVME